MPAMPVGAKPPCAVRFANPLLSNAGTQPAIMAIPIPRNATIAAIFSAANQNSTSPNWRTPIRFTPVSTTM